MAFQQGMFAKAYYGAEDAALASLTEMSNVTDVTVSMEAGESDVTTRANQGWRATASTLKECTAEFEMVYDPGDAAFTAVKNAFLNGTTISAAFLTGAKAVENSEGPYGNWSVTSFTRSEALEEAIKYSVTLKMAEFDSWIEDGVEGAAS